jgi:hypothetical protein
MSPVKKYGSIVILMKNINPRAGSQESEENISRII